MESGQGSLNALRSTLDAADAQAFVRAAVRAGNQAVWYLDAIVAPPSVPAGWQPVVWEYKPVTFIAAQIPARALASAFDDDDARVLPLGTYNLSLPALSDQLTWQRRPSRARYDSIVLPWPASIFTMHRPGNQDQQTPQGYLIGDDCPSFPSYDAAFRAFFTRTTPGHRQAASHPALATSGWSRGPLGLNGLS